ncbi:glycosyltransferase family 4 protein [Paraflavisolibacter sp. H34]|uniref:glycosyltransferase family 4 protein n=1 Tax=Huijunlia imazamoxiresistens TaxID=3127457 RepID=UPI00301B5CBF
MQLKILFLSHKFYPDIGGIEVNSEILAGAFTKAGHTVRLITWSSDNSDKSFPFTVIRKPRYRALIREHAWADVVYENNPCLRLSWPGIFCRKTSVVALRTWVSRLDGSIAWQDRIKKWHLNKTAAVIAVSESVRKKCWPGATVIGNPYRAHHFQINPDIPKQVDFVFLGRLVSDKGADLAVRALEQLKSSRESSTGADRPLSLTIIGDGPEREALESLTQELGLQDRIVFTGSLRGEELVACLNRHRYLLVPSLWEEPFGNVALEGMACGCLPIVSDGGGLEDAVGNAGIVFKRGSVPDLVASIESLLDNPEREKKLRQAAGDHLAMHHPDKVARKYLNVIEASVKSRLY